MSSFERLLAEAQEEEADSQDEPQPSPPPIEQDAQVGSTSAPDQDKEQAGRSTRPGLLPNLATLNESQYTAVTAPASGSMQILAGPGSGKTKVLTSRVAYLLQHYKIDPDFLVVVTFTNKAANEMKHRLASIVGFETVNKLMMGTFHSVCVRYLRQYGRLIGLPNNFVIADRDDCLAMVKRAIVSSKMSDEIRKDVKATHCLDVISKCKSHEMRPEQYRLEQEKPVHPEQLKRMEAICRVYEEYEAELQRDNALDFDDLLLNGLRLLQENPRIVAKVQNVLIDEFQDTNSTQYSLVRVIAQASQSLTIVGDPDQSIYGWRNAEVGNLDKMLTDFKPVRQVFLEENYRSTAAILGAALAVVRQDTKRINKGLKATHGAGSSVVLHCAPDAQTEGEYIAAQIKHIVAHSGGCLDYGDFAVLLRFGALSRNIEVALQKAGIPSRMVGGHKFFDRQEVKDVLSYLQLADNPAYTAALTRVINVPKRGVGDKTVMQIVSAARLKNVSPFEICVKIANGGAPITVTATQRKGIRQFVSVIRDLRQLAEEDETVPAIIDALCEKVQYRDHLEKLQGPDAKERFLNVEELKSYAVTVAKDHADAAVPLPRQGEEEVDLPGRVAGGADSDDDDVHFVDEEHDRELIEIKVPMTSQTSQQASSTSLRTFLSISMLATDTDTEDSKADAETRKVTLSTVHAAKGLEWPAVYVPACESGTYPFYRSKEDHEVDEERRLLYVAITRAQCFCSLNWAKVRMLGASSTERLLSPFIEPLAKKYPTLFVPRLQKIGPATRVEIAQVLRRAAPDEAAALKIIEEYSESLPENPRTYDYDPEIHDKGYNPSQGRGGGFSQGGGAGFSQGRYSGAQSYSRWSNSTGGSSGKWSNTSTQKGPASAPAGAQNFSSALSSYKASSGAALGSLSQQAQHSGPKAQLFNPTVSSSAPEPTAYRDILDQPAPPRRAPSANFKAPRPASATTSTSTPQFKPLPPPASPRKTDKLKASSKVEGMQQVPETRSSLINDAVLVNPIVGTAEPKDLLERFSRKEQQRLSDIRELGARPREELVEGTSPSATVSIADQGMRELEKSQTDNPDASTTAHSEPNVHNDENNAASTPAKRRSGRSIAGKKRKKHE